MQKNISENPQNLLHQFITHECIYPSNLFFKAGDMRNSFIDYARKYVPYFSLSQAQFRNLMRAYPNIHHVCGGKFNKYVGISPKEPYSDNKNQKSGPETLQTIEKRLENVENMLSQQLVPCLLNAVQMCCNLSSSQTMHFMRQSTNLQRNFGNQSQATNSSNSLSQDSIKLLESLYQNTKNSSPNQYPNLTQSCLIQQPINPLQPLSTHQSQGYPPAQPPPCIFDNPHQANIMPDKIITNKDGHKILCGSSLPMELRKQKEIKTTKGPGRPTNESRLEKLYEGAGSDNECGTNEKILREKLGIGAGSYNDLVKYNLIKFVKDGNFIDWPSTIIETLIKTHAHIGSELDRTNFILNTSENPAEREKAGIDKAIVETIRDFIPIKSAKLINSIVTPDIHNLTIEMPENLNKDNKKIYLLVFDKLIDEFNKLNSNTKNGKLQEIIDAKICMLMNIYDEIKAKNLDN